MIRNTPKSMLQLQVGLRIKIIRLEQKKSQAEIATAAGIDRTQLNRIENGGKNVSIESLNKIFQALEITWQEFFTNETFA